MFNHHAICSRLSSWLSCNMCSEGIGGAGWGIWGSTKLSSRIHLQYQRVIFWFCSVLAVLNAWADLLQEVGCNNVQALCWKRPSRIAGVTKANVSNRKRAVLESGGASFVELSKQKVCEASRLDPRWTGAQHGMSPTYSKDLGQKILA